MIGNSGRFFEKNLDFRENIKRKWLFTNCFERGSNGFHGRKTLEKFKKYMKRAQLARMPEGQKNTFFVKPGRTYYSLPRHHVLDHIRCVFLGPKNHFLKNTFFELDAAREGGKKCPAGAQKNTISENRVFLMIFCSQQEPNSPLFQAQIKVVFESRNGSSELL